MSDSPPTKAAREPIHKTYIIAGPANDSHQARCHDCPSWTSLQFDHRRYLAELAATEHQRAMAGWPGTAPSP